MGLGMGWGPVVFVKKTLNSENLFPPSMVVANILITSQNCWRGHVKKVIVSGGG